MLNNLGDGSTLSLDFTTGVLDPRLTFSRASGGTYVGNDGFVYGVDFATSSSLAIGTGSKSVTLTATAGQSRRYEIGQTVYIANGANNMSGAVTAYSAATQVLTINATSTSGSGSFTSWIVGNASARFDYDPTTLTPRGLLIEGSATNYMLQSTTLDPHNVSAMRTISTASITDPEGTTNKARVIAADGSTGYHARHLATTASTNTTLTISIFAKKNGYKYLFLAEIGSGRSAVRFDLDDGTTSNSSGAGFVSAKATPHRNGWWRCSMVVNVTASTSYAWSYVGVPTTGATLGTNGAQYTGTNTDTDGIYCYGFQVEAGPAATSYIATTSSTVTRAVDSCVMTGTNFSSWFNATEGTLLAHAIRSRTSDIGRIASVNDNTANESIELAADATGEFIVVDGGSTLANITPGTVTANTAFKIAGAYKLNDVQAALGGTLGVADTAVTMPTVDRLMIGQQAGASPIYLNGTIALLTYWPTRLTNAQLQSLTT
jgi:hypothetical protein